MASPAWIRGPTSTVPLLRDYARSSDTHNKGSREERLLVVSRNGTFHTWVIQDRQCNQSCVCVRSCFPRFRQAHRLRWNPGLSRPLIRAHVLANNDFLCSIQLTTGRTIVIIAAWIQRPDQLD